MYRTQRHVCEIQYPEIKVPKWHYVVLLTFESIMFPNTLQRSSALCSYLAVGRLMVNQNSVMS